jgi:hypothetical protein
LLLLFLAKIEKGRREDAQTEHESECLAGKRSKKEQKGASCRCDLNESTEALAWTNSETDEDDVGKCPF